MQIVMELNLPDSERTYKPVNVGGTAGGVKVHFTEMK